MSSNALSGHLVPLDGLKTLDLLVHVSAPANLQVSVCRHATLSELALLIMTTD